MQWDGMVKRMAIKKTYLQEIQRDYSRRMVD